MRQTTDTPTRPVSGADEARVSRRALLKVGVTAAGGLALAVALPSWSMADGSDSGAVLNAFVRIEPDGRVRLTIPSVEMGQGVYALGGGARSQARPDRGRTRASE
jgi:isoquinoline 1-oxidoreductase beta subunit